MPITKEDKRYLRNKHRGGNNATKGNRYEGFYAVYSIAKLLADSTLSLDSITMTAQVPDAFVDDLLIEEKGSLKHYHQIKDTQNISWNYRNLKSDFQKQIEYSKEKEELFKLKLVTSKDGFSEIPDELYSYTSVEYFPAFKELTHLYLEFPEFKSVIEKIAVEGRNNDDELLGIATTILGVWHSMDTPKSLKEIVERIKATNRYDSLRIYPSLQLSDGCRDIFSRLNVKYSLNGDVLYWSHSCFSGKIEWGAEKEKMLLSLSPTNVEELFTVLS